MHDDQDHIRPFVCPRCEERQVYRGGPAGGLLQCPVCGRKYLIKLLQHAQLILDYEPEDADPQPAVGATSVVPTAPKREKGKAPAAKRKPRGKKGGLRKPQLRVLAVLDKAEAPLSRKQIADKANVDLAWLTS